MFRLMIVLAVMATASAAFAQPAGAQAEVLFREGRDLMTAGKYAEACAAFEESQKLEPAVTTLLNLAGCREKANQLATAWGLFLDAERQTRGASDKATKQLNDVAKKRAQDLEKRVSKLVINVPPGSQLDGLEILRNKEPVSAVMWNRALPIDGGAYTITARAAGRKAWTQDIQVAAERDSKTVDIPALAPESVTAPPTEKVQPEPVKEEEPEPETSSGGGPSKTLPLLVGGAGVVLLGGALGFELWGRSTLSDAEAETDDAKQESLWKSANQRHYVAQGLLVAGVAATGVAVWLFVRARSSDERATSVAIDPVVGPGQGGIQVRGWF